MAELCIWGFWDIAGVWEIILLDESTPATTKSQFWLNGQPYILIVFEHEQSNVNMKALNHRKQIGIVGARLSKRIRIFIRSDLYMWLIRIWMKKIWRELMTELSEGTVRDWCYKT